MQNELQSGAEYVIELFGGLTATANALTEVTGEKVAVSTVQGWGIRKRIPQGWWEDLMTAAAERDKSLSVEDFIKQHPKISDVQTEAPA